MACVSGYFAKVWFSSFSEQPESPCRALPVCRLVEVDASLETLSQTVCEGSCFLPDLVLVLG